MKILITGMNSSQCNRNHHLKQQLKVVQSTYSLMNCLVAMGHDVTHRKVKIGENLDEYDKVIVFIAGPRQFITNALFEGLWAIKARSDCILAFDDWQVEDLFAGVVKAKEGDNLLSDFILNNNSKTVEDIKIQLNDFKDAIDLIETGNNRMLISSYDTSHLGDEFGPHRLFDKKYKKENIFAYNPNPFHRNRKPGDYKHHGPEAFDYYHSPFEDDDLPDLPLKTRSFNFASLVQSKTKKWLKNNGFKKNPTSDESGTIGSWHVEIYGCKADSQKRLTEDIMCGVWAKDWGCLMPGYPHAGSGWWRVRPLQVADAGSIIIGDEVELGVYYGKDFYANKMKASDLIEMSDMELVNLAADQKEALYKHHPLDKNKQCKELESVLKG